MQLASPLPLGHAACAELLDIWTENEIDPDRVLARVSPVLPDGLTLHHVAVAREDEPALQARLLAAEYEVHVEWEEADAVILDRIKSTLARETIRWERRGKVRDLRPLIERLDLRSTDQDWVVLDMRLSAREAATGRPEAVLDALGMGGAFARYTRRRLFID
jgi:radical SAM-linked protein